MSTLRELTNWRFTKVKAMQMDSETKALVAKLAQGMKPADVQLLEGLISRVDTSYLKGRKLINEALVQVAKTMHFLGFYEDTNHLKVKDDKGNARSCLDAFGDLMAIRMRHTENDRDLVVMRHNFVIEN